MRNYLLAHVILFTATVRITFSVVWFFARAHVSLLLRQLTG